MLADRLSLPQAPLLFKATSEGGGEGGDYALFPSTLAYATIATPGDSVASESMEIEFTIQTGFTTITTQFVGYTGVAGGVSVTATKVTVYGYGATSGNITITDLGTTLEEKTTIRLVWPAGDTGICSVYVNNTLKGTISVRVPYSLARIGSSSASTTFNGKFYQLKITRNEVVTNDIKVNATGDGIYDYTNSEDASVTGTLTYGSD